MVAQWLRSWRARREAAAVARRAIPDDLWKRTLVRYPFLRWRSAEDQLLLRRMSSLFLDTKEFHFAGGLRMNNAIVVAIAAQACLPVLRLGLARYSSFVGITVLPHAVQRRREHQGSDGLVHEMDEEIVGEAQPGGPMMLSWADVREAGRTPSYNVVIHEFVHVLDAEDGELDGVPLALPDGLTRRQWLAVMEPEFEAFVNAVDADPQSPTLMDPYGAEGIDEFFGVASESFFADAWRLREAHPALYALLARFYRQDPAGFAAQPEKQTRP